MSGEERQKFGGRNVSAEAEIARSVMFWGCISYFGVETLVSVDGHIDSQKSPILRYWTRIYGQWCANISVGSGGSFKMITLQYIGLC